MKTEGVALLTCLILAAAAVQAAPPPVVAGKGPRIVVEPAAFDFGQALQDKTLTKDFILRNLGDAPLHIEDVKTSCGCTAALPSERVIPAGGQTRLQVSLQTRSSEGRLEKTVSIRTDDAARAIVVIKLTVTVVATAAGR